MMRKRQGAALASIGNNAERKEVLELIGFAVEESDDDSLVLSSSVSSERPGRVSFGDLDEDDFSTSSRRGHLDKADTQTSSSRERESRAFPSRLSLFLMTDEGFYESFDGMGKGRKKRKKKSKQSGQGEVGEEAEEEHGGEHQSQERAKTLDELDEQEDSIHAAVGDVAREALAQRVQKVQSGAKRVKLFFKERKVKQGARRKRVQERRKQQKEEKRARRAARAAENGNGKSGYSSSSDELEEDGDEHSDDMDEEARIARKSRKKALCMSGVKDEEYQFDEDSDESGEEGHSDGYGEEGDEDDDVIMEYEVEIMDESGEQDVQFSNAADVMSAMQNPRMSVSIRKKARSSQEVFGRSWRGVNKDRRGFVKVPNPVGGGPRRAQVGAQRRRKGSDTPAPSVQVSGADSTQDAQGSTMVRARFRRRHKKKSEEEVIKEIYQARSINRWIMRCVEDLSDEEDEDDEGEDGERASPRSHSPRKNPKQSFSTFTTSQFLEVPGGKQGARRRSRALVRLSHELLNAHAQVAGEDSEENSVVGGGLLKCVGGRSSRERISFIVTEASTDRPVSTAPRSSDTSAAGSRGSAKVSFNVTYMDEADGSPGSTSFEDSFRLSPRRSDGDLATFNVTDTRAEEDDTCEIMTCESFRSSMRDSCGFELTDSSRISNVFDGDPRCVSFSVTEPLTHSTSNQSSNPRVSYAVSELPSEVSDRTRVSYAVTEPLSSADPHSCTGTEPLSTASEHTRASFAVSEPIHSDDDTSCASMSPSHDSLRLSRVPAPHSPPTRASRQRSLSPRERSHSPREVAPATRRPQFGTKRRRRPAQVTASNDYIPSINKWMARKKDGYSSDEESGNERRDVAVEVYRPQAPGTELNSPSTSPAVTRLNGGAAAESRSYERDAEEEEEEEEEVATPVYRPSLSKWMR